MNATLEKLRRPAKWVGYPLFALLCYLFSLYLTLPRERIRDLLETEAGAFLGADVTAKGFALTLFTGPGVEAAPVEIRTRPTLPGEKPGRYVVDDLGIRFGVYDALRGFADTRFFGHAFGGTASGKYRSVPEEAVVALDLDDLAVKQLPLLAHSVGLPFEGTLTLAADVTAPKNLINLAAGSASFTWDGAAVGDGKAKLVIPGGDPFLSQGLTVPRIQLGQVRGKVTIEKGRATLRELTGHSADLDLQLDGYVELREPLSLSLLHLYLKVKPAEALVKREAALELVVGGAGAMAKREDGYLGFSITGVAAAPTFLPSRDPPMGVTSPPPRPSAAPTPTAPRFRPSEPAPLPSPPSPSPSPPAQEPPPPAALAPPPAPTAQPPILVAPANAIPPPARVSHGAMPRTIREHMSTMSETAPAAPIP